MSIYNKRNSLEALGTSSQQDTLKRMKITSSSQVVDLEEEELIRKTCMEMVEATTKNEELVQKACHKTIAAQSFSVAENSYLAKHLGQCTNPRKI
jgi:hypothetical protein